MCSKLKSYLLLSFWTVCFLGCSSENVVLPLEESLLVNILCDVHIMEGALHTRHSFEKDSLANMYYNQIYERHEVTESDFISSLEAMEKDPKLLEQVYAKVLIELDSIEERSYKRKYKKK